MVLGICAWLKPAQLDDETRRAVAGGLKVGQLDVMGAAVDLVDNGIGASGSCRGSSAGCQIDQCRLCSAAESQA